MRPFYVYEHWRPDKQCCFYVGKGKGDRAFRLNRKTGYHRNIVCKLMSLDLAVEVRIIASDLTEREAFDAEIARIDFWRQQGVRLSNLTDGGDGASGYRHTAESRSKMKKTPAQIEQIRLRQTGKQVPAETREKIRAIRLGTSLSETTKAKLAETFRGRVFTPEWRKKISVGLVGRAISDETRALWSRQRKGRKTGPRNAETRAKISATLKGHSVSPETRAKITAKAVARFAHCGRS